MTINVAYAYDELRKVAEDSLIATIVDGEEVYKANT